jgi:hypothetical protein
MKKTPSWLPPSWIFVDAGSQKEIHHKNSFRKKNPNGVMHVFFAHNTITIFLIEITTNKRFISYNNPLNYSLKYGITGEYGKCILLLKIRI